MSISAEAALDIAARHGLQLVDAFALAQLAIDEADADRIARRFEPELDERGTPRERR
jgi:hypothetical protein